MGHAKTRPLALKRLTDAIHTLVEQSAKGKTPENIFMPADPVYFQMFYSGKPCVVGELKVTAKTGPRGTLTIHGIQANEYGGRLAAA